MNKQELIAEAASKSGLSRSDTTKAVEAILSVIGLKLKSGESVRFIGFGSFSVHQRQAKIARNPRTNQPTKVPASKYVKFKSGKDLKTLLNG